MSYRFVVGVVAVAAISLFVACGGSEEPYVEVVGARWATAEAESVPALIASSDAVFVARVTQELPQREETLPGPEGRSAAGRTFPISRYEAVVESSVTGGVAEGATVVIEQAGGEDPGDGHVVMLEGDELVEAGKTYLFFASQKDNGTWTAAPYGRLEVKGDGSLAAAAMWRSLPASAALEASGARAVDVIRSAAGE
jgi:hypothetical protein